MRLAQTVTPPAVQEHPETVLLQHREADTVHHLRRETTTTVGKEVTVEKPEMKRREGVSQEQIFRHAHMFLDGTASDWFFTFVDEMDNWETFEKLVRIRFGNPNQEQGIRSRIQGRKQHRNEKFIEFASDIERLNKQLSKPLSTHSKFQTLWQNMHSHYRTKIAPGTQIKSLKDLTEACQRIDAVDTSLNPSGEIAHQRMVNNVDVEESENDSEASADVNVVRTRQARDNRYTARRREQPEQEGERENGFRQQPPQHQRTERNQGGCILDAKICD
ncbi:hypothetical protein pipiens_009535 [Culex pipiens pipiens]|uniref:Retrotransposon gag domain-containing protein n=1 Tax=Culex pipiens pipiens TaxID=38569 RepID=A0ABD1DDI0_CULPP